VVDDGGDPALRGGTGVVDEVFARFWLRPSGELALLEPD
jgi:hypothetical protein